MKKITCVITDDEPIARQGLQRYVERVDFLTLTAVCEDAMQLNTLLRTTQPDLLLLDIEMPYLSGLDLLASLARPPRVIITSAYEQYALRGYELDVADYLLKPISFDRFLKAVNKVQRLVQQERQANAASALPATGIGLSSDYIFVRADRRMHKLRFCDILFIEAVENYICIHREGGKLLVRSTLCRIAESLPAGQFLQVHKSYLVNLEKIELIDGNCIRMGKHDIPIARNFREEVRERIGRRLI